MAILVVDKLGKRFGGIEAVSNVHLSVEPGEVVGLFGPNGAGKTTLFGLIAGTIVPSAGRIAFEGRDITRLPAFKRARLGIGRTFQIVRPFRSLSVRDNLVAAVPVAAAGRPPVPSDILDAVGLGARLDSRASELTLGMLKRLEVARALAIDPRLLLLDEPLAGLTAAEAAEMLALIRSLKARATVLVIEHNVRQTLPVCDRAFAMDNGRIIAAGSPEEVRRHPDVVRAYLGEEAA